MNESVLPPNASDLERIISSVVSEGIDPIPVPIRNLWNPKTCPKKFLPWLAWAMSVDEWDNQWPETIKRQVILDSTKVHRHKGTVGALKRALADIDMPIIVTEWFREEGGEPYTFRLDVDANIRGMERKTHAQIDRIICDTKNVRSRLTKVRVNLRTQGAIRVAFAQASGDVTWLYPRQNHELSHRSAALTFTSGQYGAVKTTIFPV